MANKLLGISASFRRWGNTEILVRHALNSAAAKGSQTKFIRLTDLDIGQCTGCFACLRKSVDCIQKDQFPILLSALRWADGVILGTPVYFLCSAGSLQVMMSRFFRIGYTEEFKGKPGLAVISAGQPGWETFAAIQASLFFNFLGIPVIDHVIGYGQGPGEVLLDENACTRARNGGAALSRGDASYRGPSGICPVCHLNSVVMRRDGSAHCMVCDLSGKRIKTEKIAEFIPDPDQKSRFAPGQMHKHYQNLILTSTDRFKRRKPEIKDRLARLKLETSELVI